MRALAIPGVVALLLTAGCNLVVNDECRDKECDEARWLIVNAGRGHVGAKAAGECSGGYNVEFVKPEASEGFIIDTSLSVRSSDLRLAITTIDGVVHLADFGAAAADVELADNFALAAAWAPAGDRLAVLTGDPRVEPLDLELLVYDDALNLVSATPLEDRPGFVALPAGYALAWSPSGDQVAVTSEQDSSGKLVNLVTEEVVPLMALRARFLADDVLVVEGGDDVVEPGLDRLEVADGAIVSRRSLEIPEFLLDADAETGVLLTIVQGPKVFDLALRTATLGPNRLGFSGGGGETYELIPLTTEVEQALAASGVLDCGP